MSQENDDGCGCDSCNKFCSIIDEEHPQVHDHEHFHVHGHEHENELGPDDDDDHVHEHGHGSVFSKHFWVFMGFSGFFLGLALLFEFAWEFDLLSQIFALGSVIMSSHDVAIVAFKEIKRKRLGASTLMMVAAIGSFLIVHGQEGAMAIFLYALAEKLEDISADKARDAVGRLLKLAPDMANLKTDDGIMEVPTERIKKGDIVAVKPGGKVPVDGIVVSGESYVDTHAITGESVPRLKKPGDLVYASSINGDSLLEIKVTSPSTDTLLAKITRKIKEARANKSNTEKFIEKFSKYYTPTIFIVSLAVMVVPWLLLAQEPVPWIYRGLILLVISCPCALTLSTPLSMVAALTKLSKEGILVKGGKYIEELKHVKMFGFDKTATITEGRLKIHDNIPFDDELSEDENLQLIASLEANSDHPIARAIVAGARDIPLLEVSDFQEVKGKGIRGIIDGSSFIVGSVQFMKDSGVEVPGEVREQIALLTHEGKTPVLLAKDGKYLGMVTIRDNLRVSAPILFRGLKHRKIKSMIISGDTQSTVDSIADCLFIDERYGELLPSDKLEKIKEIQAMGQHVAMVGDGINDAPALTQANVGIAMGASSTDIALESADLSIMNDDLTKILVLLDVAKIANRIVRQNIWLSIIIKVSFAVLTVIGLMTLAIAVGVGDMGVSLIVILNGFRVFRYKSKFQDISEDMLEVDATKIVCNTCKTMSAYPQHHGREMVKQGDKLVCWKSLVAEISPDACKATLSLECPTCNHIREVQ